MILQDLIIQCTKKSKFFTQEGHLIDQTTILNHYEYIKTYLLEHANEQSIVAINLDKNYKYVLTMLACMEIGLTFIPLKNSFPAKRINQIQKLSSFDLLLDDNLLNEILDKKTNQTEKRSFSLQKQHPLYIIFTSGSTGEPKGVVIQRQSFENFVQWVGNYFSDITNSDKLLNTADFTFDLSMLDIALLITKNLEFKISNFNNDIFKLAYEIEKNKITTMATVPNNFNILLSDEVFFRTNMSSLKHLLLGGARFSFGLYQNFKLKLPTINCYNLYGPTEATVYTTAVKLFSNDISSEVIDKTVTVGKAITNMKILVLNENMQVVGYDIKGDVYIEGPQVMAEYLNNQSKTNEVLLNLDKQTIYKTGDIGLLDKHGNLFITGRSDDTIKVEGYRVNLSDIDSYIHTIPNVIDCATIAIRDDIKENLLVLYVKVNAETTKKDFLDQLHEVLPTYQIPQKIFFIQDFPLNSSGKISKKDLREKFIIEHQKI